MDFILDKEIRELLPPLTKEEYEALESEIVEGKHVDPLVIADIDGELILADGYNRFEICQKHSVQLATRVKAFKDRAALIEWVVKNQLGRRNLTEERIAYYRGKEYLKKRKNTGNPQLAHNELIGKEDGDTAEKLGSKHGVSGATMKRDAAFAEAVDELPPEEKETVLSGKSGMTKAEVAEGAAQVMCPACKRKLRVGQAVPKSCGECKRLRTLCPQCERDRLVGRPPKEDCKDCEEARKPKPKSGSVVFDDKACRDQFGKLGRLISDRVRAYGNCTEAENCRKAVNQALTYFDQWRKK